jgi:single-strand DNA-binding protein
METTKSVNKVEILGFLGKDAVVKTFKSGRTLINMSVATSESYKNYQNEWVTNTTWHNVALWKNKADETHNFLKKGTKVSVVGKLNNRKYTDKEGKDRFITEIVAQKIEQVNPI